VSSQRSRSTVLIDSIALSVISERFPIGVGIKISFDI
jgi:hypothetical protein